MPYKDPEKRRACTRESARRSRAADLNLHREYRRRFYAENPEYAAKAKEDARQWHIENRDRSRENKRRWYEANADKAREKSRETARVWHAANRDKVRAKDRCRRARLRDACSVGVTPEQWRAICEQFSDGTTTFCAYCSVAPATDAEHVLALDNGGRDEPSNVVPACKSCNSSKGTKLLLWQWIGKGIRSHDVTKRARK